MVNEQTIVNNVEQGIASYVDYLNNIRLMDLFNKLEVILSSETGKLSDLATKTAHAISKLDWAKTEINNLIGTNRGGERGIHGFISEIAETGIRTARDVFQKQRVSVQLLNDNGPADILLRGEKVQMKFYENILKEIRQASKYSDMKIMFPKDHVEVIDMVMNDAKSIEYNHNRLSYSQIINIRKAIEDESAIRNSPYDQWLEPSLLKYKEVQKEVIDKTISREVNEVKKQAAQQKTDIKQAADTDREMAHQEARANFGEASKVAGIGAAVQGGLSLGIFLYRKRKEGKEVWNFDIDDWKECGVSTATGAIKGGISGYAIYGLTNVCHLAAPSAGAITSGLLGISSAIAEYRKGALDADGFIDLVTLNAIDATGAAIGASLGQVIIPIPVVGALIGSIASSIALRLGKDILNEKEIGIIDLYQEKINEYISELDKENQLKIDNLLNQYHGLGELQEYSFDYDTNVELRFVSSIRLARTTGIPERNILKNEYEIDEYFLC